tara:strand:- start:95 stop:649 length:555 start_codon:yes stop_codon:yes gene_type:complete
MNLKKEEIIWLLKEACGDAPVENDKLEATPVLDVDMSSMTISGQPDHEISMAQKQLRRTADYAGQLQAAFKDMPETNLPAWVQAKITTAADYMDKVYHYLEEYMAQLAYGQGMSDVEGMVNGMLQGEITAVNEEIEGEVIKASHSIEVELSISKSDMKKLHAGEKVTLKDTTGNNDFTVTVSAS